MATLSPPTAPTKRKKSKRRQKKKKKGPGNQQTGSCTLDQTADASILLVEVADSFDGKPLTLEHRATLPSVGNFSQQSIVTLGQDLVVQFDLDIPDDADSRLCSTYGTGFDGIQDSIFIISQSTSGELVAGSINGRDLVRAPPRRSRRTRMGGSSPTVGYRRW